MSTMSDQTTFEREAFELGAEHARNAASWAIAVDGDAIAVDGDGWHERIVQTLRILEEGDSEDVAEYLPARPNLSGEWAGEPSPLSLFRDIVSHEPETSEDHDLMDALADAYERGVDETFEVECERVLRAAL
jgi:hypothetical protein